MLECRGISVFYGQHQALNQVSIQIAPVEIVVILGANGAGKSTLLQAVAGMIPMAESGQVLMGGRGISGLPPHRIVEAGVALVPEGRRIFGALTVEENLLLGAYAARARSSEREHLERVFGLFPRLAERKSQVAHTMSGGEQQMVAIGRAIMSDPAILMLDEPSLGLSPLLCAELFRSLESIRQAGVGILLVEQNAKQALAIADRGYLLENGQIVGEDSAEGLARNSAVQEAYLGGASGTGGSSTGGSVSGIAGVSAGTASFPAPDAATSSPGAGDAPTTPAQVFGSSGLGTRRTGTDALLNESIASMVQRATEVQTGHILEQRGRRGPAVAPTPEVAGMDIEDLVQRATKVQADFIREQRGSTGHGSARAATVRPESRPPEAPRLERAPRTTGSMTSNSLAQVLAEIEQAAHRAQSPDRPPWRGGSNRRGDQDANG